MTTTRIIESRRDLLADSTHLAVRSILAASSSITEDAVIALAEPRRGSEAWVRADIPHGGRRAYAGRADVSSSLPPPPSSPLRHARWLLRLLVVTGLGGLCTGALAREAVVMLSYDGMSSSSPSSLLSPQGWTAKHGTRDPVLVEVEEGQVAEKERAEGLCVGVRSADRLRRLGRGIRAAARASIPLLGGLLVPQLLLWLLCWWDDSGGGSGAGVLSTWRTLGGCLFCACYVGTCRLGQRVFDAGTTATATAAHMPWTPQQNQKQQRPQHRPHSQRSALSLSPFIGFAASVPAIGAGRPPLSPPPCLLPLAHPLRLRIMGFSAGFTAATVLSVIYAMQFIFVYYDFAHDRRLALTAWLLPSAAATGTTLLALLLHSSLAPLPPPPSSAGAAEQDRGNGCCEVRSRYIAWLAMWAPAASLPHTTSPTAAGVRSRFSAAVYPLMCLSALSLLTSFVYYAAVFTECMQLAAFAFSTVPTPSSSEPGGGGVGRQSTASAAAWSEGQLDVAVNGFPLGVAQRDAMAAAPYAEQYPHSLLLHPRCLFSVWWGSDAFRAATASSSSFTDLSPVAASLPVRLTCLHTQLLLPVMFLLMAREAVASCVAAARASRRRR